MFVGPTLGYWICHASVMVHLRCPVFPRFRGGLAPVDAGCYGDAAGRGSVVGGWLELHQALVIL